jgi:HAD superfamily hydrolase (TIGR01490 family)
LKPLARHKRKLLDQWHVEFMQKKVLPMITQKSRDLIESHRGDARVIITATNSFVTAPIARELGVENLIATEPEEVGGEFTGKVKGLPSFREGKVERLNSWMAEHGIEWQKVTESWFYSDSLNDLPLLGIVSHPVAVDPDETLKEHALRNDWRVISLR